MGFDIVYILIVFCVILVSMTVHEMVHAVVGYLLGDKTAEKEGRISLNPLVHIDPYLTILLPLVMLLAQGPVFGGAKPVPFNPHNLKWGEFGAMLVGISGPLSNFLLAFIGAIFYVLVADPNSILGYGLQIWIVVNLGFFIFNMIPIPPLDGSRLLYYLAPEFIRKGMRAMELYGLILIFILIVVFSPVIGNLMNTGINACLNLFNLIIGGVL